MEDKYQNHLVVCGILLAVWIVGLKDPNSCKMFVLKQHILLNKWCYED